MKKYTLLSLLFIFSSYISFFMLSCNKEDNEEEEKSIEIIEFADLEIEEAQELVQGKWELLVECGGVAGCQEVNGSFHEFVGTDKLHMMHSNGTTREYDIQEWSKYEILQTYTETEEIYIPYGCKIIVEDEFSSFPLILVNLRNDTLFFTEPPFDIGRFYWRAKRVK